MRVAYVAQASQISGAERSLQTLLLSVSECGIRPLLICPPGDPLIPWCRENSVAVEPCPLALRGKLRAFSWLMSVRKILSLLRAHRIDLVHCNQVFSCPAAGAAARRLGIPRVCHLRNEMTPETLRWWCAAGLEGVVCISRYVEQQFGACWPADYPRPLVRTILNPVLMPPETAPPDGASRRGVVFGFIGQLIPIKGLLELLLALASVPASPEWSLLVAGKDPRDGAPYESRCRRFVAEQGWGERVRFLGFLDDVAPFYRSIDVAVVPSLEEPMGRVPLEAASYARPSIAFAAGGLPETIRDGETGWVLPVGDVPALTRAMVRCLESPSAQFGRKARAWVEETCDPRRYAGKVLDFYRDLQSAPVSR